MRAGINRYARIGCSIFGVSFREGAGTSSSGASDLNHYDYTNSVAAPARLGGILQVERVFGIRQLPMPRLS